ncbi:MAG: fimbrillin family protein [Bacteroidales bacterium]|nr:fimbrillin family protein [Bacteroidales bacterium]MBR5862041.1 fimbrillin family protein [Bacteroidales bacterium]
MKRYITFVMAALAFVACQHTAEPEVDFGKVQVEPVITKATEVNFENGDQIGLTMAKVNDTEKYADNACFTFDGTVFSGDLVWYADAYSEADIYAYYPYDAINPTIYALFEDQTDGIAQADFMAASKKGVLPTPNAITMVFKHMMTKLVINVENLSESRITSLEVVGGKHVTGIDLAEMTLTEAEGTVNNAVPQVKAYEAQEGKQWQAIIIPGQVRLEISISLENGKKINQSLAEMTLKSGGQYTINARIIKDNMIVSASGEIENWSDEGEIRFEGQGSTEDIPVIFAEYENHFVYHGIEYKTITLADGNKWMAENLRYIPEGKTVSKDPEEDAGIWYPAANAEKVADPALAEALGLLYDAATAFGVEAVTLENAATFEGTQGICPTGWHIPTIAEMTGLVGHCSNTALVNPDGAYYDATINGASLAALAADGWDWQFASMRNKANTAGKGSYTVTNYNGVYGIMSYMIGSSNYQVITNEDGSLKNVQYYYLMPTYNASNEKVTVAYGNFLIGASIRCVKNK